METFFYILRSIGGLIVVIWLANVALKYLNHFNNGEMKTIQVVERLSVHKSSSLAIVKIVNEYYLMSFSEQKTETLQKFTAEEAREIEQRLEQKEALDPTEAFKNISFTGVKEKFSHYFEQQKQDEFK